MSKKFYPSKVNLEKYRYVKRIKQLNPTISQVRLAKNTGLSQSTVSFVLRSSSFKDYANKLLLQRQAKLRARKQLWFFLNENPYRLLLIVLLIILIVVAVI